MSDRCDGLVAKLQLLLDRELTGDVCSDLEAHLRECPECLERFEVERLFKELVKRKCAQEAVPEALLQRIRQSLRSETGSGA